MSDTIKAVLWDFGGVITSSPFEAFNKFEIQEQIPVDFIRQTNAENHETNAWAKLESSEINLDEFDRLFRLETEAKGHEISGKAVINLLSGEIRPSMVNVLQGSKKTTSLVALQITLTQVKAQEWRVRRRNMMLLKK